MRITRIAVAGAAAAVMIAGGAGLAAASASTVQRPAVSGTEHFNLVTTQPSASTYTIIASGLFTGYGVDHSGSTSDSVKLTAGGFKVNHGGPLHILKEQLNKRTCLLQFAATAKITLSDGTGAYTGISGSGTALISGLGIAARRKGQCDPNATPLAVEQTITATAHVSL
jgi:hypothetical protein